MNLFDIDSRLESAFEKAVDPETGEILDEAMLIEFEQLQMERNDKIENIACWIKNLKADAAALKAEKDAFAKRQKAAESKAESLSKYLNAYLAGQRYKGTRVSVSYRKTVQVEIADEAMIPDEFKRVKVEPNKTDIKLAIRGGREVPGASLVEKNNMVIS